MKTLVIMPAFNEQRNIGKTIRQVLLKNRGIDVLIIDDGSKDDTLKLARKTKAEVVSHPFNMGYGVALQTGYKYALENDYDVVVQIDADGQHDPKYVGKIVDHLVKNKADVVIGSRFKNRRDYQTPLLRRAGMLLFNFIVNKTTGWGLTDCTSGYQAISKKVLPFLVSDKFPVDYPDADLLIMLYFRGYKVTEMPMRMYESETGQSMHSSLIKNFYYVAKMCLSIFTILLRKTTGVSER